MKTLQIFYMIILLFCISKLNAQAPLDWNANPYTYEYSQFSYAGQGALKTVTASDGSSIVAGAYTDPALYNSSTNPVAGRVIVQKYDITGNVASEYIDVDADWVQVNGIYPTGLNNYVFDMVIDASDNVYVIISQSDTARIGGVLYKGIRGIIKLDANMNLIWKKLSPANNWLSMIFDSEGNIIVNGTTKNNGDGSLTNIVTMKYSPDGDSIWQKIYSGSGSFNDFGNDVTADGSGNIYVTGSVGSTVLGSSEITMKYDAEGNLVWSETYDYNTFSSLSDQGASIVATSAGDVYIEGMSDKGSGVNRATVLKYDANGNLKWNKFFDKVGGSKSRLYPVRIRIDANENVYAGCVRQIAGFGQIFSDNSYSIFMYKFKKNGHPEWLIQKDTSFLYDFDVNAAGDVYMAGTHGSSIKIFVAKFNTNAADEWKIVYTPVIVSGQTSNRSTATCVSINPNHPDEVTIGGNAVGESQEGINFTSGVVLHFGGTLKLGDSNLNDEADDFFLQAYPNPANHELTFTFSLNETSGVSVKVFDVNGKLKLEKPEQSFETGLHQFELNTTDLASGIYFCNIISSAHHELKSIKLIVQH